MSKGKPGHPGKPRRLGEGRPPSPWPAPEAGNPPVPGNSEIYKVWQRTALEEARAYCIAMGDEAWAEGDTRNALKWYEDGLVPRYELMQKAEALREASDIAEAWRDATLGIGERLMVADRCPAGVLGQREGVMWCLMENCHRCREREALTRDAYQRVLELLPWSGLISRQPPRPNTKNGASYVRHKPATRVLRGPDALEYLSAADAFIRVASRMPQSFERPSLITQ